MGLVLLMGKALDIYSRLSDSTSGDYSLLNQALLKSLRGVTLVAEKRYSSPQAVKDMFARKQLFNACPIALAAHMREKAARDPEEVTLPEERFMATRNNRHACSGIQQSHYLSSQRRPMI